VSDIAIFVLIGDVKLQLTSFCALAFLKELKDRNADCCFNTADNPPKSDKNFVKFCAVTSDILCLICRKLVDAHRQKYGRLRYFQRSSYICLYQTFSRYRGVYESYNTILKLRRLA